MAEDVERQGREALARSWDAMGEDERREEDGRDAGDVDEDVREVGVVGCLSQESLRRSAVASASSAALCACSRLSAAPSSPSQAVVALRMARWCRKSDEVAIRGGSRWEGRLSSRRRQTAPSSRTGGIAPSFERVERGRVSGRRRTSPSTATACYEHELPRC